MITFISLFYISFLIDLIIYIYNTSILNINKKYIYLFLLKILLLILLKKYKKWYIFKNLNFLFALNCQIIFFN